MVRCYLRSPLHHLGCLPDLAWGDFHVDEVVVYGDRVRSWGEVRGLACVQVREHLPGRGAVEESVIDYDVAVHAVDA
jgi:hypothetical protein